MSKKNIVYVGLGVDDTAFHGAGIIRETGEIFEFKSKPDHGVLRKKLNELFADRYVHGVPLNITNNCKSTESCLACINSAGLQLGSVTEGTSESVFSTE
jgi:hypothetical protein